MPSLARIYDDNSVIFIPETRGSFTSSAVSVSTFAFCGSPNFTILLPTSLSTNVGFTIQANNSNPIIRGGSVTGIVYTPNTQPDWRQIGAQKAGLNPQFNNCWVNIGLMASGAVSASVVNTPVRFLRLTSRSVSAGFVAYLWTDTMTSGN